MTYEERKGFGKANADIRIAIMVSGVKYWEVADELGVSDSTFTKWLRKELSDEKKQKIIEAITRLKEIG